MKTSSNISSMLFLLMMSCHISASEINAQLTQCRQVTDDQERLLCYDQINQDEDSEETSTQSSVTDNEFPPLLADLNEPNLYVSYGSLDFLGDDFNAFLFGAGIRHSIRDFEFQNGRSLTFNVFGQIRSQFDVDELDTRNNRGGALINTDFFVGGEIVQSLENWNWRFSYTHKSTHLGDEFIIDNQNFLQDRINLSYETIKWTAHKNINNWDLYAGLGFITRSEPGNLDQSMWQLGWQYQGGMWHNIKPIWAVDLTSWGAYDWTINVNMRAGIEIHQWTDSPFQLLLEYQDGHSPYGQFYTDDLTFTGLTLLKNW